MFKNVASQKLIVYAFDSTTNLPKTGDAANLTAYVDIDFGGVTVLGDTSAAERDATNAKGYYIFDLTQGETNGNTLMFSAKSATANIVVVAMPAVVFTRPANFSTLSVDSNGRVDIIKVAGTSQTARDLGASVLLSTGTGTGQLDFTSGVVKANTTQFAGSNITSAAGIPEVKVASLAANSITNAVIANDAIGATEIADGAIDAATFAATALDAVWSTAARVLTAGTNIVLAKGTGVTGFTDLSAAQVNAEVVDALAVDTYAEPAQGSPAATTTLAVKLGFLYKAWRNRATQTATAYKLYNDDAVTVDHKATVSDDGTTFDSGEKATGP